MPRGLGMGQEGFRYRDDLKAWWPDYDHDPVRCMQFVRHGLGAIDAALPFIRRRGICVQAGGHAGFWAKRLAEEFHTVYTFEPEPLLFQCLLRNCTAPNVVSYEMGLGAVTRTARFKSHVSAGSWRVDDAGEHLIALTTVDSLHISRLDALFLDIEGYEVQALKGAEDTLRRSGWPPILCELLPRAVDAIEAWMAENGYTRAARYGRDGIFTRAKK